MPLDAFGNFLKKFAWSLAYPFGVRTGNSDEALPITLNSDGIFLTKPCPLFLLRTRKSDEALPIILNSEGISLTKPCPHVEYSCSYIPHSFFSLQHISTAGTSIQLSLVPTFPRHSGDSSIDCRFIWKNDRHQEKDFFLSVSQPKKRHNSRAISPVWQDRESERSWNLFCIQPVLREKNEKLAQWSGLSTSFLSYAGQ